MTTIERAFPMDKDECTPAIRNRAADGYQSDCAWRPLSSDWQKRWGARRSRDGVRGRDGLLSSFLGASRAAIRLISRFSFNLESAVSCLAGASGVCSCEPRKLYGSQSWTDHRTGRPPLAHPGGRMSAMEGLTRRDQQSPEQSLARIPSDVFSSPCRVIDAKCETIPLKKRSAEYSFLFSLSPVFAAYFTNWSGCACRWPSLV